MWSWLCCSKDAKEQQPLRRSKKVINETKSPKIKPQTQSFETQLKNKDLITLKQQIGKQIVEKKDKYVGEQMDGVPHGTGTKNYVNGDYYKGEWVNGVKEGKGQHYYFQLRTIYNGQWKHDMKNGNGHQTEANGSWFQGQFKDGVRHGKGTYFDKQLNAKYSQLYVNGSLKQRKQIGGQPQPIQDEFPTLKLDKQRFNTADLIGFQEKNPEIKELDLDFLLKYYGLRRIIGLQFIDTPISEWTIKQVHSFLQEVGLEQYKSIFYDNKIKGKDLASLDQDQMKQDLKMRLGDRKILKNYIQYLSSLTKTKKKDSKKQQQEKRRGSLSVKKKKQSLLNTFTRSIEHEIIQEDDQWNEGYSQDSVKNKEMIQPPQKRKNQYETQNWDKFISRDIIGAFNYHSQNQMQMPQENKDSDKTQRGSNQDHDKQVEMSPSVRRKHSEDKQIFAANPSSVNQSPTPKHQQKKDRSSTSSESSEQNKNDQQEQMFKIKRKKTSFVVGGPSQQIRQLYEFLRENQSLDFIIKQKDIEIIEMIGEGGYGKVSRGRYMQCPVAVKDYMKAGRSHKSREQFMKQVHILSDLKHPNIVLYMGLCITVNRYQLVTEFMENGSLYDQLHIKKTKFTKEQQLQIIDDIVQGMVYLHNMKNMLHRDLKSSNVLIAQDYKVKLCDFGLSGHKNKNKKQKKNRIGTYQWMAPQVIRNQELDFFSDVYSFGVILWEILTQQIPYSGMSQTQIIGDVGYDKNHKLPNPPKGSDQFIISIMHKCLQRDPAERPTFIEIQREIKEERNNRPYVKDVWNIL